MTAHRYSRDRRPADRGFTLIELLISITLSGIIMAVIATAFDVSFRHDNTTTARFNNANNSLSITDRFPIDVAATPPGGREAGKDLPSECAGGDPAGSLNIIRLTWSEAPAGAATWYRSSYRLAGGPGNGSLLRVTCKSTTGAHAGYSTASVNTVASDLAPVPAGWGTGAVASPTWGTSAPAQLQAQGLTVDEPPTVSLTMTMADTVPATVTISGTRLNYPKFLPAGAVPSNAAIRTQKATSSASYDAVGNTLAFTASVLNAGTTRLDNITVVDPKASGPVTCDQSTLAPGFVATCTYSHTVTQADIDAGTVTSVATGTGTPPASVAISASSDPVGVNANQRAMMTITKSTTATSYRAVGDRLDYSVQIKNTGNVTLGNMSVSDPKVSDNSLNSCSFASFAPGAVASCAYHYNVAAGDLGAGSSVSSFATAKATKPPAGPPNGVTADSNTTSVPMQASPSMTVSKDTVPPAQPFYSSPTPIAYVIHVVNTGNVRLNSITVTDPKADAGSISCDAPGYVDPTGSIDCHAQHTATSAEVTAQATITNQATVTATPAGGGANLVLTTNTVAVPYAPSANMKLTVGTPNPTHFSAVNQVISFPITVLNTGSVKLTNVNVSVPPGFGSDCAALNTIVGIDSGGSGTCTATKTVVSTDLGANITATFTASANGGVTATSNTAVVTFDAAPRLTVTLVGPSTFSTLGEQVTYTATVQNNGNSPLTAISIGAQTRGVRPWNCGSGDLAPNSARSCTTTYATTVPDSTGSITNQVTAQATVIYNGNVINAQSNVVTTASTVPCTVTNVTAVPSTVARFNDGSPSKDQLSQDVVVNATVGGICAQTPLRIQYYPLSNPGGVTDNMGPVGSGTWTATIQSGTQKKYADWDPGPARVDIVPKNSTTPLPTSPAGQVFYPFTVT